MVGFDGRNKGVLSGLYLVWGFAGDCIVILLSFTRAIIFTNSERGARIYFHSDTDLYRVMIQNNTQLIMDTLSISLTSVAL